MKPLSWLCTLLLCLVGVLRPAHAQSSADLDAIAEGVITMRKALLDAAPLRTLPLAHASPVQVGVLHEALYQLQLQRAFFDSALPRLSAHDERTALLRGFVQRWSHDGIEDGLRGDASQRQAFDAALLELSRHFRAPLFKWRTPLPLFRP